MKKMVLFIVSVLFFACTNGEKDNQNTDLAEVLNSKNYEAEKYFRSNLIIILSGELTDSSKKMSIQEYKSESGDFIPVFTSRQKFTESTRGTDIGKPIIEVNGFFLLSLLEGNETIRVNPELNDEKRYSAMELIEQFKEEIIKVKKDTELK